jgi:hypothetical protein
MAEHQSRGGRLGDSRDAERISDARLDELIEWGESYAARPGSPRADTTLALHELRERRSLPWTAAPEMLAEIERLRDALALLIGTIEAQTLRAVCERGAFEDFQRGRAAIAKAEGRSDE